MIELWQIVSRSKRAGAALLAALFLLCSGCQKDPPNIVWIVVDTLRADVALELGDRVATPNLDRLARDGVVFRRAFSHAPMTLPSHVSLFSSRLPFQTGVLNNWQKVPEDLELLPQHLRRAGYASTAVVSLGTLCTADGGGLARAFDRYDQDVWCLERAPEVNERLRTALDGAGDTRPLFFFAHYSDPHEPYNSAEAGHHAELRLDGEPLAVLETSNSTVYRRRLRLDPGAHELHLRSEVPLRVLSVDGYGPNSRLEMEWPAEAALEISIRVEQTQSVEDEFDLRLWVSDQPPLAEIQNRYVAEVEYVDGYLGQLLDWLEAEGLYEDSWVVLTSDHGEALGEGGHVGHVQGLDDAQIRVPLILKPPRADARRESLLARADEVVSLIDVVPTLLEACGLPPMADQSGVSLFAEDRPRFHIAQTHPPEARQNRVCLRDERFKMTYILEENRFEMFDLREDPREALDVYATQAHLRAAWPDQLKAIATAASHSTGERDIDPDTEAKLRALGY